MIRILTTNERRAVTITIDGQLVGDYVDAVETSVNEAIKERRPVHLYLRDVSPIDEHGRKLLSRLATKGVELSASGVYSRYIVAEAGSKSAVRPGTMPTNGTPVPNSCHSRQTVTDSRRKTLKRGS
jgi:hypothetical protein